VEIGEEQNGGRNEVREKEVERKQEE